MSGCGDDELRGSLRVDERAGLPDDGHVLGELSVTAAREDRDNGQLRFEMVLLAEGFARLGSSNVADEGMADEFCGNAAFSEESLFERENAKCLREAAADDAHAPGTPGPKLRANVINVADAVRAELP